tara:strand:- start:1264 stop:1749 length:486 start_codon:yes stop_codon:yes gene_type:complete
MTSKEMQKFGLHDKDVVQPEIIDIDYTVHSPLAVEPVYNTGNSGIDLTAIGINYPDDAPECVEYDTGIAMAIPVGYVGLLFPRSSVSKKGLSLANSCGVIDPSYRGTIRLRYYMRGNFTLYTISERIGQIVIVKQPIIKLNKKDSLPETARGAKGFGSTGA